MKTPRHAVFALGAIASSFSAHAGVLVVDPQSGPFTEIATAVAAASPGDTVLAHAGVYATPILIDKAIQLIADPPHASVICRHLHIVNAPAGGQIVLRGIDVKPTAFQTFYNGVWYSGSVFIQNAQCPIWIEDGAFTGAPGVFGAFGGIAGGSGILVDSHAPVILVRCTLKGGPAKDETGSGSSDGGPGITVRSTTSLYGCTLVGSAAGIGSKHGGHGAVMYPGMIPSATVTVLFSGCTSTGGNGVLGGAGLCQTDNIPQLNLHFLDSTFTGGAGSQTGGASVFLKPTVAATLWPDVARSLEVSAPATALAPMTLDARGVQGDVVMFVIAQNGGLLWDASAHGLLAVTFPFFGPFALTTITDPSGRASVTVPTPSLPPGVSTATVMVDPVFFSSGNAPVLGAPSVAVLRQ